MTELIRTNSVCGLCGASSEQTQILSTSAFGAPDLDSRPPELARSTLSFSVASCPECGFAGFSDLALPEGSDARAVQEIVDSDDYQALRSNSELPALAGDFLCRVLISAGLGDLADAGWDALRAAWATDDAGEDDVARTCRDQTLRLSRVSARFGASSGPTVDPDHAWVGHGAKGEGCPACRLSQRATGHLRRPPARSSSRPPPRRSCRPRLVGLARRGRSARRRCHASAFAATREDRGGLGEKVGGLRGTRPGPALVKSPEFASQMPCGTSSALGFSRARRTEPQPFTLLPRRSWQ